MKRIILLILTISCIASISRGDIRPIHGTIYDATDKSPIIGAMIKVEGTWIATQSDTHGRYTIKADEGKTLIISYIGYQTKRIKIDSIKNNKRIGNDASIRIDIYLQPATSQLNEVVVSGYGVKHSRKTLGYSTSKVTSKDLNNQSPQVYDKLSGKVYGLSVNTAPQGNPPTVNNINANSYGYTASASDESYKPITENAFLNAKDNPLSTFSIDVDEASYSNVRRFINNGQLPPVDAVRIEEMINYFKYDLSGPSDNSPVAIHTELSSAPWNPKHRLLRIGLKAKTIDMDKLPPSNLVFLLDVSGSMGESNKLPLVKASMKMLVDQLRPVDKVAIVVYSGQAGLKLAATAGDKKTEIKDAIDALEAGGSTAGGEGIKLAYKIARENFIKNGNNRIIMATDGDFNVGDSSDGDMETLITRERSSNVPITIMGFGMGNLKDSKMEILADKGNGNYAYIDNLTEARKTLITEYGGTMFMIAKDVKLQIEFNPAKVQSYRLLGYEDRLLNKEDFNNDKKDAGDMGSGHTVTAFYEIIPAGVKDEYASSVDPLKYQKPKENSSGNSYSDELMTIKFRYKRPDSDSSKLNVVTVPDKPLDFNNTSNDFRFASAVAEFGMLLRGSEYKQKGSFDQAIKIAKGAKGKDDDGYRSEFIRLAESAKSLAANGQLVTEE